MESQREKRVTVQQNLFQTFFVTCITGKRSHCSHNEKIYISRNVYIVPAYKCTYIHRSSTSTRHSALPRILLSNVCSWTMDYLQLQRSLETDASLCLQRYGSVTDFWMMPFNWSGSPRFVQKELQLCTVRLIVVACVFASTRNGARTLRLCLVTAHH